jgi:FkbM family methyltransferase
VDLGSNIGLTIAHYRFLYPQARLVGVEMDADNVKLARLNAPAESILHAAAWPESGVLHYTLERGNEFGARPDVTGELEAPAIAMDDLIPDDTDFVKMDVEGTETALLDVPGWAKRVKCLKVEVHPPASTVASVASQVRALGFGRIVETPDGHHVLAWKT